MTAMLRKIPDWPTLALLLLCYGVWALGTTLASAFSMPLGIAITAVAIALFASLQHEMIHGHPFRNATLNAMSTHATHTRVHYAICYDAHPRYTAGRLRRYATIGRRASVRVNVTGGVTHTVRWGRVCGDPFPGSRSLAESRDY